MTIGILNVSSRGQIVIPEGIRKNLGIKEGSKLFALEQNGKLILTKEDDVIKNLAHIDKEESGWLALAEKSLHEIWNNEKDNKTWRKYL